MEPFKQHFVQDLTQTIKVRHCGSIVFNADNESNVVSVSLFNGSEPVAISGSVVGAVVCPDGATVPLTGSYSGNTASITLTGDCFAMLGEIGVGIQIVNGAQKTTVLKAKYNVETLTTENVVDPGSRITLEVGDLVSDIETATAAIPASDMASLMSGIAPTFSDSVTYKAGAYVYYGGDLYCFTADHNGGTWTGSDVTAVVLCNDVSDLKSAVNVLEPTATSEDVGKALIAKTVSGGKVTEYEFGEIGGADPEVIEQAVTDWLDDHPEATTTVQDGAITIPKLANDVKETIQPLTELSMADAAGNTALLTSLLATQDVKLKPGVYPVESTIVIDGHILDMNGSKFTVPEYQNDPIIYLQGFGPCIKNGEIEGSYISGVTPSGNYRQTAISILGSSDVLIQNMEIHHICGRGISDTLASQYGELDTIVSADTYSSGVHTSAKRDIKSGYKYVRTVGGYGYNSVYTVSDPVYTFYDANDTKIGEASNIVSMPVEIPEGTEKYTVKTETGRDGIVDGFIPYNCGFTNYNCIERIENCKIHHCMQWGIANLFGPSYLKNVHIYNVTGNSGMDIEDHQSPMLVMENCSIEGTFAVNAVYTRLYNCQVGYSMYFGRHHALINCYGVVDMSLVRDFNMTPTLQIVGGQMGVRCGLYDSNNIKEMTRRTLLITSGPLYDGYTQKDANMFGPSKFIYRRQTFNRGDPAFIGFVDGVFIKRVKSNMNNIIMKTDPGSRLIMYIDCQIKNTQLSAYLQDGSRDCYGLIGYNCIIYPAGYKIYDSSFKPDGTGANIKSQYMSGAYINCLFDAEDSNIIAAIQSGYPINLSFTNCRFKNLTSNVLLSLGNNVSASVFTFTNCIFEDAPIETLADVNQYILPSLGSHTIVINGTSYTS